MAITIEHAGSLALDCIDAKTGEFDKKKFHDLIPGALLPDMARSLFIKAKDVPKGTTSNDSPNPEEFGMTRKALHFEMSQDGKDFAWIEFPSDLKAYTPERILDGLKYHVPEDQKPCAIGEPTNIKAFEDHNQKLKSENPSLYEGLMYHYRYDVAHDGWKNPEDPEDKCGLRGMLDDGGAGRFDGKFMYQGEDIGAKGVRTLASDLSQDGILYLSAQMTNKSHGKMRLDNDFIEKNVKPALYDAFDKDFADSGLKYMHVDEKVEEMEKEQNGKFFSVYSDGNKEWFDSREKNGTQSFDPEVTHEAPAPGVDKGEKAKHRKKVFMNNPFKKKKTPAYGLDRFVDDLKNGRNLDSYGFSRTDVTDGSIRYRWQSFDESMLRNPDNGYLVRVFMDAGSDGKPTDIVVTAETAQYGEDGVFEAHDVQNLSDDDMKDMAIELATDMDYSEPFLESLQKRTDKLKESSDEKPVNPELERERFANRLGYAIRSGKHLDDYGFECSKNLPDGRNVYSLDLVDDDGAFRYVNIMTDKYGESMGIAGGKDYPDGTGDHFGEEHLQFVSRSDLMDITNRVMDLFGYTDEDAESIRSINNQSDNLDSLDSMQFGEKIPSEDMDHYRKMMNTTNLNVAKDNEAHTYGGSAVWNDDHHPDISDEQWDDLCRNGKVEAVDEIGNPVTIFDYERDESLMKEDEESYGELLDAGEDIKAESDSLQKGDAVVVRTLDFNDRGYSVSNAKYLTVEGAGPDGIVFNEAGADGKPVVISYDQLDGDSAEFLSHDTDKADFVVGTFHGDKYHAVDNRLYRDFIGEFDPIDKLRHEDRQQKALHEIQPGDHLLFGVDKSIVNGLHQTYVDDFVVTEIPDSAASLDQVKGYLNHGDEEQTLLDTFYDEEGKSSSDIYGNVFEHGTAADPSGYIDHSTMSYVPIEENEFSKDCEKYADTYYDNIMQQVDENTKHEEDVKKADAKAFAQSLKPGDIFVCQTEFGDDDYMEQNAGLYVITSVPVDAKNIRDFEVTEFIDNDRKYEKFGDIVGIHDVADSGLEFAVGDPSGFISPYDGKYHVISDNSYCEAKAKDYMEKHPGTYTEGYVSEPYKIPEADEKESQKPEWTKLYVPENRLQTRHPKDDTSKSFDVVEIPLGRQKVESFTVAHKGEKEFDGKGDPNKDVLLTVKSDRVRNVTVYDRKTGEREKVQKMPEELVSDLKAYKSYQKSADAKHKEQAAELSSDVKYPETSVEDQM